MNHQNKSNNEYHGFELGPIRPPSEAGSLLLRVTRNCPWNKCTFCGLYKGQKFSIRPVDHICRDIDRVRYFVDEIDQVTNEPAEFKDNITALQVGLSGEDHMAFHSALCIDAPKRPFGAKQHNVTEATTILTPAVDHRIGQ